MHIERMSAIITCYNRREKTLACLDALFRQDPPSNAVLDVYVVDDGSSDGTGEGVRAAYPAVRVLQGNGSLYNNGGMRLAFAEALKSDYDYYLWLNDDTTLYPTAIESLLAIVQDLAKQGHRRPIVVGSTCDPETGALTYGGFVRSSWWHPLKFRLVEPGSIAIRCETMNGNCVLVPRTAARAVGNLDASFTHAIGDFDYGLRALRQGCSIWVAPGYIATCARDHSVRGSWEDAGLSLRERLSKVRQAKGLPPSEWKVFARRHAGVLWPIYWLLPYARVLVTSVFGRMKLSS